MKLVKSTQCEDIQRYLWYHAKLVPMYHQVVPAMITAAELKTLYGASKQFLNCTIPEIWGQGYNKVLGKKSDEFQTDFIGTTNNLYEVRTTLQGWQCLKVIESEWSQYEADYDLTGFTYTVIDDNPDYWPKPL